MECQFCHNSFKTKPILKIHQQSANYCVQLQNLQSTCKKFMCDFCGKNLASKQSLKSHISICNANTPYIKNLLEKKDKEIQELKDKITQIYKDLANENSETIKEIAKQPRTQTQNNTTNQNKLLLLAPLDLSRDKIKQAIENGFTYDHFLSGQKGVAKSVVDNLLKDDEGKLKYVCTDPSRAIFKYRSSQGDVERDVKARKLTDLIADDVIKRSTNLVNDKKEGTNSDQFIILLDNYTNIRDMIEDNGEFRGELATLTTIK